MGGRVDYPSRRPFRARTIELVRRCETDPTEAEQGSAFAQFRLGRAYEGGDAVPPDDEQAYLWYRKAADQRFAPGEFAVGMNFARGRGVHQDDVEAVEWVRRAAAQGHALAQYSLGMANALGKGIERNGRASIPWFQKAADQGLAEAQFKFAVMSIAFSGLLGTGNGDGLSAAVESLRKASDQDLATCTTPNGSPCEHPDLRPINWPICPIIDSSSTYGFVTLRGGGLFVVDATTTPMSIVAEYDKATVRGNGCGGIQAAGHMYINSGGSPVNVSSGNPHHPDLYGFDVYRFPLSGYSAFNTPNRPAPRVVLSKTGMSDSHGVASIHDRYLWVMDRHANVAEIIHLRSGRRVKTVDLAGAVSADPAPDLVDRSPVGDRLFVALRGSVPLSGDPHNATGSTPGLGIIEVTQGGRRGRLATVVPLTNPLQQPGQAPDAHGLRVRLTQRHW